MQSLRTATASSCGQGVSGGETVKPTTFTPKQRIVSSFSDSQENHRGDFETCPNCSHRMEPDEWDKIATVLILSPRCFKSSSVAVMSECPKCFSGSWVHHRMNSFEFSYWPKKWVEEVEKKNAATKLQALREWGASLCWNCKHLESATVENSTYRHCVAGMGPAVTECSLFKKFAP